MTCRILFSSCIFWYLGVLPWISPSTEQHLPLAVDRLPSTNGLTTSAMALSLVPAAGAQDLPWGPRKWEQIGRGVPSNPKYPNEVRQRLRLERQEAAFPQRQEASARDCSSRGKLGRAGQSIVRSPPTRGERESSCWCSCPRGHVRFTQIFF